MQSALVTSAGRDDFARALSAVGADGMICEFHAEVEVGKDGRELVVTMVNLSPEEIPHWDTNVYEARLVVDAGQTLPFTLDNLPDSFRYDRTVAAYGVNGGVEKIDDTTFRTTDVAVYDQPRPTYWDDEVGTRPDITFATLANDPIPALRELVDACERWGSNHWTPEVLTRRAVADGWDDGMRVEADAEAAKFFEELARLRHGLSLLETDGDLRRSFRLANRAFAESPLVRHPDWRSFQLGFLLCQRRVDRQQQPRGRPPHRRHPVVRDRRWQDGDVSPLRAHGRVLRPAARQERRDHLLGSLPAAHALAPADAAIRGRPRLRGTGPPRRAASAVANSRSGSSSAPAAHPTRSSAVRMRARASLTATIPTCRRAIRSCSAARSAAAADLQMRFDQTRWALDHRCTAQDCPWEGRPLPFRIVDDEIYRSLPTVVIGTLDKAASISMQAAMRGFYGPPSGRCPVQGHGFTYAPRSGSPGGCLFPGCTSRDRSARARRAVSMHLRSVCRTSSTYCATASARSTRTTRRSSTPCRTTTDRCRRSSRRQRRLPGTTSRSPRCTAARAGSSRVPGPRPAAPSGRATPTSSLAASPASRRAG